MTQTPYSPPTVPDVQPFGPYETERQASQPNSAKVAKGVHGGYTMPPRDVRRLLLIEACETAGVQLGAYDRAILLWLAGWDTSTVQVVIGLIHRANRAGKAAGAADVEQAIAIEAAATAPVAGGGIVPPVLAFDGTRTGQVYLIGEKPQAATTDAVTAVPCKYCGVAIDLDGTGISRPDVSAVHSRCLNDALFGREAAPGPRFSIGPDGYVYEKPPRDETTGLTEDERLDLIEQREQDRIADEQSQPVRTGDDEIVYAGEDGLEP